VTGTVKNCEPGKSIDVEAKGETHSYDLTKTDATFTISPDVKAGSEVRLTDKTDSTGHQTVTIKATGKS